MNARVLLAGFKHETNTFSVLPTGLDAYRARTFLEGEAIVREMTDTASEVAGYLDACAEHGWTPVPVVYGDATPSGRVTREAFEYVCDRIVDTLSSDGPFDAVLLVLHGAMVADHVDDGEGELLARIRGVVGPRLPVVATLDLHANVTDAMAEHASALVSYRTYPHVDQRERAREAAAIAARAIAGEVAPVTVVARGALLDGVDHGRTTAPGPMSEMLERVDALVGEDGVLSVSVNAGFAWADVFDTGPSVVVVGDGDRARFQAVATALMEPVWESRHRSSVAVLDLDALRERLRARDRSKAPLVIADYADNPGGGGYGDTTRVLGALIDEGVEDAAFSMICDPEVAAMCHAAGVGATLDVELGGKMDPKFAEPLSLRVTVTALSDGSITLQGPMLAGTRVEMGPSAAVRAGGVDIVVASGRFQSYDRRYFEHLGIDPTARQVVAVKSSQHFRAAFAPIASEVLVVDAGGGLTSSDLRSLPYEKIRRPIYPLDLD